VTRTIAIPPGPRCFGFGGGRAALGYDDGRLRVVDLQTGATLIEVQSEAMPAQVVALSGRWLVAGVGDRVEVWDTLTSKRLVVHPPHPDRIVAIAVERTRVPRPGWPEGKWVASIDRTSPGARIADLRTGVEVAVVGRIATPPTEPEELEHDQLLELRTALATFSAFRIMHADVGAADDGVEELLHERIRHAWQDRDRPGPLGPEGWGLPATPQGVVAAERLDEAADLVDAAIRGLPLQDRAALRPYVAAEAWRLDLDQTGDDVACHAVAWLANGHLAIEHDDGVGVWDVLLPARIAEQPGTLLGVEGDHVLVVDPMAAELRSWQPALGRVRTASLPPGRLVPSQDHPEEVVLVDDATVKIVSFAEPPRIVPAGVGRLGTPLVRLGDDLVSASWATLRVCPFDALEVDDPRAGLPIHAVAPHPDGTSVAVVRVLDDHDEMRVERWAPGEGRLALLPGAISMIGSVGVGRTGRIWAGGAILRIWSAEGVEEPAEAGWRSAAVYGRWAHAGNRLLDLDTGEVRTGPPVSPDRKVVVRERDVVVLADDGLAVFADDGVTLGATESWPARAVRAGYALPDGAVLILFVDGGVSGWSEADGLQEPWSVPPVVDAAVLADGRVAFGVLDQPASSSDVPKAWVEIWDGTLRDPVRGEMLPVSGSGVVVGAAGPYLAIGDATGQLVLVDLRA
jgi:hypothetical protein